MRVSRLNKLKRSLADTALNLSKSKGASTTGIFYKGKNNIHPKSDASPLFLQSRIFDFLGP